MNIGEADNWYSISQICRNRIIAVCDFLNYLKYIERGLVKSSAHDVYWEIVRLRKDMVLARLGLNLSS
jgi:Rab-3A-interacting protein